MISENKRVRILTGIAKGKVGISHWIDSHLYVLVEGGAFGPFKVDEVEIA